MFSLYDTKNTIFWYPSVSTKQPVKTYYFATTNYTSTQNKAVNHLEHLPLISEDRGLVFVQPYRLQTTTFEKYYSSLGLSFKFFPYTASFSMDVQVFANTQETFP